MNSISQLKPHKSNSIPTRSDDHEFCKQYRARELAFNLVNQLNHLVKDVQQHRGISMGLLAGNRAFERDLYRLQGQINRRLSILVAFASEDAELLSKRDEENIRLAWDTISSDWQDDKLSDNFELHSHFIEQLIAMIARITKSLESPVADRSEVWEGSSEPDKSPRHVRQIELLNFLGARLPEIIESLAKIRGLASFAAAVGSAEYRHDRRLRFFLECAKEQNEKLRHCSHRLHEVLDGDLNAKYVIGEMETKFAHLIELVTHDVLSGETIKSSSSHLFSLATMIIDKYWEIVDEGLSLIRLWHRTDLEAYVIE